MKYTASKCVDCGEINIFPLFPVDPVPSCNCMKCGGELAPLGSASIYRQHEIHAGCDGADDVVSKLNDVKRELENFIAKFEEWKRKGGTTITASLRVSYLCDHRACGGFCGECQHTFDISHAKDFENMNGTYIQKNPVVYHTGKIAVGTDEFKAELHKGECDYGKEWENKFRKMALDLGRHDHA